MNVDLTPAPADTGKRLDHYLREQLPEYSRARLQEWIKSERVLVNGTVGKASYALRGGETITVQPIDRKPLRAEPEDLPLEILYEDDDLIAIDKPAGMVVHAGAGVDSGTLVNALLHRFAQLSQLGGDLRPGIVHRLDRYTSGVLLVAKTDAAHRHLADQFAGRRTEKTYIALVHGGVKQERGRIEKPIARDPSRRVRMTARLGRGREAWSEYRVLRRFSGFTLLEVNIGTGRTHQIRAHLASIGHPVVGDTLYGAPARVAGREPLGRFFLHAQRIRIQSPSTGAMLTIEAGLPYALSNWLSILPDS